MRNTTQYFLLVLSFALPLSAVAAAGAAELSAQREAELQRLVRQECGMCHGLTLKGGLGPSLQPDSLRGKPDEWLVSVILNGSPGTPMPPWNPFLNKAEASWIVGSLREGQDR